MHGVLDVADLADLVPDVQERTTFACGPAGLLEALGAHHAERGIPLLTEQFRVATVVAGEGGTISFDRSGTTVEADGSTPILDAAEDAGVLMPSGCRMGICYGCVLPMREGAVRDLRTGEVTTAVREGTASSRPASTLPPAACHRPLTTERLTDHRPTEGDPMTVLQKKPTSPIDHLTPEDIEQIGVELDAIRQSSHRHRGAERRGVHPQGDRHPAQARARQPRRPAVLAVPAGLVGRYGRPLGRQDPREHGDRPQRHARPVGLDA